MDEDNGFDLLGADDVTTIPTAGANYVDAKTVAAVQSALIKKGYDLGTGGVDGLYGSKTKAACKKLQISLGADPNGRIDETVISALGVTPGVLPPGVSIQGRAAVQAQVALDAATLAEHAATPTDVQAAAQMAVDAAPPAPPELKQAAKAALVKAQAATTPAQVKAAAAEVQTVAQDVHTAVAPNWWSQPAWAGGPLRWQLAVGGGAGTVGAGALLMAVLL
jgi:peptidoglycan hydrolase-like protein with peptidoglycan-binding domain